MTPEEAIANLENLSRQPWFRPFKHFVDALKLGSEALKRVRDYKKMHVGLHYTPMPGETED